MSHKVETCFTANRGLENRSSDYHSYDHSILSKYRYRGYVILQKEYRVMLSTGPGFSKSWIVFSDDEESKQSSNYLHSFDDKKSALSYIDEITE